MFVDLIFSLSLLTAVESAAALPPPPSDEATAELVSSCGACHGAEGNSSNPLWPNLAGQHPQYLVTQLKAFQGGIRKDPNMSVMAAPLRPQEMERIAAFFAAQKVRSLPLTRVAAAPGERIYRGGNRQNGVPACMACHGPTGVGNPVAGVPALSGQQSGYSIKQLMAYKKGERTTDGAGRPMRTIAGRMADKEIEDVATYLSGLH
jgi:cytochrome c553